MKIEKIRDNKKIIVPIIVGLLLILAVTMLVSRAKYRITSSLSIAEGKITNNPYDFKIEEMYIKDSNGEITAKDGNKYRKIENERMPGKEYIINEKNSYCLLNGMEDPNVRIKTNGNGEHVIANINKRSNCYIYFDGESNGRAKEYILTNKEVLERAEGSFNETISEDTTGKIYKGRDDDGATYYYAGNPSDNWVKFGGYYWRIIRINGDGSIRMIYQGTEPNATGEGTQIGTSAFNTEYDDNKYVGYFYEQGQVHGTKEPSTVYTYLNNWFASSNIKQGSEYYKYIDENAGFCGDRTPSTSNTEINNQGGTGIVPTYYGAHIRLLPGGGNNLIVEAIQPAFNCFNDNDLYTYSGANQGNKKLANPVGMITADEASYGGIALKLENQSFVAATNNYLYTSQVYWTISPFILNKEGYSDGLTVYSDGRIRDGWGLGNSYGVRPVINLKADIGLTGNGTSSNPYEVLPDLIKDKEVLERKSENKDFNVPFGEDTTGKIYKGRDDDGATYYYAGNPSDNWVKFGGYYWRIIRINGDGSIRMIYQGTEPNATGEGTQIGTHKFNNSNDNNRYVGYMYGNDGELRGLSNPSNAYTVLNNWFASSNIKQGSEYYKYIDLNAGFCGDRTPSTSNTEINNQGGTGTTTTYYGSYVRLYPEGKFVTSSTSTVEPTYNCANNNDLYTYSGANKGNKKLANPVGMITADEVSYAGMVLNWDDESSKTTTNYLYTAEHYWTMSPSVFGDIYGYSLVFHVHSSGCLAFTSSTLSISNIRPVLNLKANLKFSGNGTTSSPYEIIT